MSKGGKNVATQIYDNKELLVKLVSTGILMTAAKEKVDNYLKQHSIVIQEMMEDEESMEYFNMYYEENEEELKNAAEHSVTTSAEVEKVLEKWRKEYEF
ncbi:hypothetical protein E2L07_05540 [Halalkalibacterium halodurans]|uniref:hypothetical protein n=1 Tax=Halalkalibacterium halodurans TaxID=86665 RepID=UPI00106807FA|nr:hypothetical protein [Halalkalibacterium halodurans]TES56150.1 hypothetical protein E2L07_05540 [Halalkalibacterium halodurans]